jgi:hypothetical protein
MLIDPAFMPWAEGKGVKLKGVEPRILPGRGIGIVAVRDIRVSNNLKGASIESGHRYIHPALHPSLHSVTPRA